MADLTSTVSITGVINGRRISVTSTAVYEDIVDVASTQDGSYNPAYTPIGFDSFGYVMMSQNCPDYIFAVNRSTSEACVCELEIIGGAVKYLLHMPPGGFVILNQGVNGEGVVFVDSSATNIDLFEVQKVSISTIPSFGFVTSADIFAATKATT